MSLNSVAEPMMRVKVELQENNVTVFSNWTVSVPNFFYIDYFTQVTNNGQGSLKIKLKKSLASTEHAHKALIILVWGGIKI